MLISKVGETTFLNLFFSKILTTVVSTFTSYYVHLWSDFFVNRPLSPPMPSFDGRVILYPSSSSLRDYMSWRQVDCTSFAVCADENLLKYFTGHINNLYNTTFWALVQKGNMESTQAEERLKVSSSMAQAWRASS